MRAIETVYDGGDRFTLRIRQHYLSVDQPPEEGGEDFGPTPTELFVAGLATCVGFYAERFLRRHALSTAGLRVSCDFTMGERPARVTEVRIDVDAPGVTLDRREAFVRVIDRCTVHNTLRSTPSVQIDVRAGAQVA